MSLVPSRQPSFPGFPGRSTSLPGHGPQPSTGTHILAGKAAMDLPLLPQPHHVSYHGAPWRVPPSVFLHIPAASSAALRPRAQLLAQQFAQVGVRTQINSAPALRECQALLTASPTVTQGWQVELAKSLHGICLKPESYRLVVTSEGALLQAHEERGFYYAGQTLRQLLEDSRDLPGLAIEDAPLLQNRALHLDLRGWAIDREEVERIIELAAHFKFNCLILEYERHYRFDSQPGVSDEEALTPAAVTELLVAARDRGLRLVPLLNCIGDASYLLKLDPYRQLREDPRYLQQFCPSSPATLEVFSAMAEDLLGAHSAPLFHIGGDQARFLGQCQTCENRVKQLGGRSALLLDYLGRVARYLISRHRQVLLWDDLIRNMTDDQIRWLPPEVVLIFRYGEGLQARALQELSSSAERYAKLGRNVWGGVSHWPTQRHEALDNLDAWLKFAEQGLADGMVVSASSREHILGPLSPPPELAWPLTLYAAERAWGGTRNVSRDALLPRLLARYFGFREQPNQERAWVAYDLALRGHPREARQLLAELLPACTRHKESLALLQAWCGLQAFQEYLARFEQAVATNWGALQAGEGDPFHYGRLRWRIEDLKALAPELAQHLRSSAAVFFSNASIEEYLAGGLAYGLRRLDELAELLSAYPLPDKEWQQPVRI